tara:strand:- start:55 stop:447 length:393 start_codon:yes stop_codon:yes gene_type:complete
MGYLIELSFSLKNVQNHQDLITEILDKAEKNNCDFYFKDFEFSKKNTLCVYNIRFDFENNIISFIRYLRNYKKIKIDYLGIENSKLDTLFASKKYLNKMDKDTALQYLKNKKNGFLKELSPSIYSALKCH